LVELEPSQTRPKLLLLLLLLTSNAMKGKREIDAFRALFSLMYVRSITREPLFIGGPWV
jgi:hypothetical protein